MVKVLRVKVAVAEVLEFIVRVQVEEPPVHPPDQPAKLELSAGAAVSVTAVPGLKIVPWGLVVIVTLPGPDVLRVRVTWEIPDWVTVKVCPAMVRVPVLDEVVVLAATEKAVEPLPLLPEVMVIQPVLLEAVQEQPVGAVTVTFPVPAPELKVALVEERE